MLSYKSRMKDLLLNFSVQLWQKEPNYSISQRARPVGLRSDTVCMGRVLGCSEPLINKCQVLKFTPKGHKAIQSPEILYMIRWRFYKLVAKYTEIKKTRNYLRVGFFQK